MKPLHAFFGAIASLILLRLLVGLVSIPIALLPFASLVVSVLFISIPIFGFYRGASYPWSFKKSSLLVLVGVAVQVGFFLIGRLSMPTPLLGVVEAIGQTGLLLWTFGLGGLLALFIKDKNLLLPMAVFLALFDVWLVFAPEGIAHTAVSGQNPIGAQILKSGAYMVPKPMAVPQGMHAAALAYVGPADWLFLAMFFIALYRFELRTRATFVAIVPTLAAYLLVVLVFPDVVVGPFRLGALPALLPIGAVILIVNRKEFKLTREEKISTILILFIGVFVVAWRLVVSNAALEQQPVPLPKGPSQSTPAPLDSRALAFRD